MIVLDASAGHAFAFGTAAADSLRALMYGGEKVIAPDLYMVEMAHVLEKYVRGGRITKQAAQRHMSRAVSLIDEFVPTQELYLEALSESLRLGHSVYDMFYFVLARRNAATLCTLDKRLIKLALRNGLNCVYDEEVAPGETWTIRAETEQGPAAR